MNKTIINSLIGLLFAGFVSQAHASQLTAPVLSIVLPNGTQLDSTHKGLSFDAGIYLSNIADLGGFDFDITFNSTYLSLNASNPLTSNSVFNVVGPSDTVVFANSLTSAGNYHFAETYDITSPTSITQGLAVSAATPGLLLGTLHFQALNTGINNFISIAAHGSNDVLVDYNGSLIVDAAGSPLGTIVHGASVTILAALPAVPLPAATWLFTTGLLGLLWVGKQKS